MSCCFPRATVGRSPALLTGSPRRSIVSERHEDLARLFFGARDKGAYGAFGAGFRGGPRVGDSGEAGEDVEGLAAFTEKYSGVAR